MKIFQRPCSIIKENEELKWLCTFKNFPIKQNCVAHSDHTSDLFLDMQWGYTDSGNIELMNLVDPDLIYLEYHNPGTVGKTWREHHRKLLRLGKQKPKIKGTYILFYKNCCFNYIINYS